MKADNKRIIIIVFAVLVAMGGGFSGDCAAVDSAGRMAGEIVHVAIFKVPDLSENLAKEISKALAREPGVLSGKSDFQKESFSVVFDVGKTSPKGILKMIAAVTPNAKLENVEQTQKQGVKLDCGKCPRKNKCPVNR
jgi:hypothetical protein